MIKYSKHFLSVAVAAIASVFVVSAVAQEQAQEQEYATILEEVIVTANKRTETMQDVAVTMSAMTEEGLDQMGVSNFEDFARSMASLNYTTVGPNKLKLIVRGLSEGPPENLDYQIQSTVSIYIDETPITSAVATPDLHVLDLERIELLRGPQGTLYGAGSMGGTLKMVTNKPDPSGFSGRLDGTYSNTHGGDDNYELSAVLNVPAGDKNAFRFVAYTKEDGGFIDNTATGEENWNTVETSGGRLTWLLMPNENWDITSTYMHQTADVIGRNRYDVELGDLLFYGPAPDSQKDTIDLFNFNVAYHGWSFADLVSSTSYYKGRNDFWFDWSAVGYGAAEALFFFTGTEPIVWQNIDQDYKVLSEELRLVSTGDGPSTWTAGLFLDSEETAYDQTVWANDLETLMSITPDPPFGSPSVQPGGVAYLGEDVIFYGENEHTVEQLALFGEYTYAFNDSWSGTIGARWFRVDMENDSFSVGAQNMITGVATTAAVARLIEAGIDPTPGAVFAEVLSSTGLVDGVVSDTDDGVNPRFAVEYRPNDSLLTYALASKGYRIGGVNSGLATGLGAPATYGPDSLWNYELGFKSTLAGGRMTLNGAIYYLDWSDIISVAGIEGFRYRINGDSASVSGAELEWAFQATENWYFNAGISYNDSQLEDNICSDFISGTPCTPESDDLIGLKGDQLIGSPKLSYTAAIRYDNRLTDTLDWRALLDFQHVGKSYDRYNSSPNAHEQGDYDVVNLRFTLLTQNGWEFTLFGRNLTDERGVISSQFVQGDINPDQQWLRASVIRPRTYGVTVRYFF
jgi:iron complex outermembrane receptor protein